MCGRFALYSKPPAITRRLGLPEPDQAWVPRYNVTPGSWITGAYRPEPGGDLLLGELWWGYIPKWAGDGAPQPINARVEKVATSRYYLAAFKRHRCLVPVDGWYEWLPTDTGKQPYFLCRYDRELLFLAGIWAEYADGSACCAIITEPARGPAQQVHDRMPLALDDESLGLWLDPDLTDREIIRSVIRHIPADLISHWPVSRVVNRPGVEGPELIEPITA